MERIYQCLYLNRQFRKLNSIKEVLQFLLEHGVPYIYSERFCQGDLVNYLGRQRAIECHRDNPSVRYVSYNDNTIKSNFQSEQEMGMCKEVATNLMLLTIHLY